MGHAGVAALAALNGFTSRTLTPQPERPGFVEHVEQHQTDLERGAGKNHRVGFVILNQFVKGDGARALPINFDVALNFVGQQLPRVLDVVRPPIFPTGSADGFENGVNNSRALHPEQPMADPLKTLEFLLYFASG